MHCLPLFSEDSMTNRKYFSIGVVLLMAVMFATTGCKQKQAKEESPFTKFEMALNEQDTTQVTNLVNSFFELVEGEKIADAVAMLYEDCDSDKYGEPVLLDNEKIASVTNLLKSFPIISHRIEYIKFREAWKNEVKVTAVMAEATDSRPEIKTVFYFKPIDYLGSWHLCLVNTNEGDRRVIKNAQADSMATKYASQLEEKEKAKANNNKQK